MTVALLAGVVSAREAGLPQRPAPLEVDGFAPASHVAPDDTDRWPRPVTVALHGNYDRPEWQCAEWKEAAGFYGWVLCPRGRPTPWAEPGEDRWTYRGPGAVSREVAAAIDALAARYPGKVAAEAAVLAGFSLGAIYAPAVVRAMPGRFSVVFLIEGAADRLDRSGLRALKRAGVRGVGFAMSTPERRRDAQRLVRQAARVKLRAVFVDMRGAGHAYRGDFPVTGRKALEELLTP